jgi:DNA polymerase-4
MNNDMNLFHQKEFKIIHIDMDCFYAAVEMRDNPKFRDIPIAIGGPSKTKGVLCTSNYKAREFGVRAAMPTFKAFQLCPHLTLVRPNFHKYEKISAQIREIFYKYTDLVQPLSLDEAYLDVTNSPHFNGSATMIAKAIQKEIYEVTGLTASAGVSFNKMLAKIASDWKKPNGIFVITPEQRMSFIKELPLKKIPGIGKVSSARMERLGLVTCGDVLERDLFDLINIFGKRSALDLYEACNGISNSRVSKRRQRKSFGIERTFFNPVTTLEDFKDEFDILVEKYQLRLSEMDEFHLQDRDISHISIKIRFSDFQTHTKEVMIDSDVSDYIKTNKSLADKQITDLRQLLIDNYETNKKDIRLIGIGIKFKEKTHRQLDFQWTA